MNINLTLIGQMIAFVCFVVFCMKYVWPPILAAMAEREKKIADGLAAADRASTGIYSRAPPDAVPRPPGCCTECVASNTTGQPVPRMIARLRMSDTRLL